MVENERKDAKCRLARLERKRAQAREYDVSNLKIKRRVSPGKSVIRPDQNEDIPRDIQNCDVHLKTTQTENASTAPKKRNG
jgi:hypothetical protein